MSLLCVSAGELQTDSHHRVRVTANTAGDLKKTRPTHEWHAWLTNQHAQTRHPPRCVINHSERADKTHPSFDGVIRQFRLASLPWARENCESFKRVDVAPLTSVGGAFSHGDMFIILPTTRAVNCLFSSSFWWVGWVRMNNALLRPSVFSIFLCSYTEVESR